MILLKLYRDDWRHMWREQQSNCPKLVNFWSIQLQLFCVSVAEGRLCWSMPISLKSSIKQQPVRIVALSLYGVYLSQLDIVKGKSACHSFSACKSSDPSPSTYRHHMRQRVDISPPDQRGNALHSRKTTSSSPNPRADSPTTQTGEGTCKIRVHTGE